MLTSYNIKSSPPISVICISDDSDDDVTQNYNSESHPSDSDETDWTNNPYSSDNLPNPDYISSNDSVSSHSAASISSLEVIINYTSPELSSAPAQSSSTLRQTKLTFEKVDRETYNEQCARDTEKMKVFWEARQAAELARAERKEEERKVKDKLRKQQDRAEAKAEDIRSGRRTLDGQLVNDKRKVRSGKS